MSTQSKLKKLMPKQFANKTAVQQTVPPMPPVAGTAPAPGLSLRREFALFMLIPLLFIAVLAGILWVPSLLAHPKYDFIYSYCSDYQCVYNYTARSGVIAADAGTTDITYGSKEPELYYFTVATGVARQLDAAAARTYRLDTATVSPDGYRLTQSFSSEGFFGSSGNDGWQLKNGLKKKPVQLSPSGTSDYASYGDSINFLGWVRK